MFERCSLCCRVILLLGNWRQMVEWTWCKPSTILMKVVFNVYIFSWCVMSCANFWPNVVFPHLDELVRFEEAWKGNVRRLTGCTEEFSAQNGMGKGLLSTFLLSCFCLNIWFAPPVSFSFFKFLVVLCTLIWWFVVNWTFYIWFLLL